LHDKTLNKWSAKLLKKNTLLPIIGFIRPIRPFEKPNSDREYLKFDKSVGLSFTKSRYMVVLLDDLRTPRHKSMIG